MKNTKPKKYKPMSQGEITHFSTQNKKYLDLSSKSLSNKPFDIWELQTEGNKKAKAMLKRRKVFKA